MSLVKKRYENYYSVLDYIHSLDINFKKIERKRVGDYLVYSVIYYYDDINDGLYDFLNTSQDVICLHGELYKRLNATEYLVDKTNEIFLIYPRYLSRGLFMKKQGLNYMEHLFKFRQVPPYLIKLRKLFDGSCFIEIYYNLGADLMYREVYEKYIERYDKEGSN